MEKYCDIVPQATGWIYVIDGIQSASCYHTYDLAMDAARADLVRRGITEDRVFRRQGVSGAMMPVQGMMQGATSKFSSSAH